MSVVVQFKPKGHSPSEAKRAAIEAEFERMAVKYGCFEVMTVAAYLLAIAIERTEAKQRPTGCGWAADVRACLKRALKRSR
jgi:hypothetical protein